MAKANLSRPLAIPPAGNLTLLLILFLAFALRVSALSFGLPHLYHADEPIVVNHALAYGTGDLNPHFFKIPPLISYLLFFFYGLFYISGRLTGHFEAPQDLEALFYGDPTAFYLIARFIFGAAAGTLSVYLLYRLTLKHFTRRTALLAAFFLSICFLHVRDSHFVYADIPLVLVLIAGFFPILEIAGARGSMRTHVAAGAWIGLAAAVKYNGAALVIPYMIALLISEKKSILKKLFLTAAISAAVFIFLNPFALLDYAYFYSEIRRQSESNTGVPFFHHLRYSLFGGLTTLLFPAAAGIFLLKTYDKKKLCLAAFIFFYYAVLAAAGQPYDRYVLPLIPFLLIFSADFLISIRDRFNWHGISFVIGLFLLIAIPLLQDILFIRIMTTDDTRTQAKSWIEKNIPSGSHIALGWDFLMPRLSFSKNQLEAKKNQAKGFYSESQRRRLDAMILSDEKSERYNLYFLSDAPEPLRFLLASPTLPYNLQQLKDYGVDYVILPESGRSENKTRSTGIKQFYQDLEKQADLAVQFSPYKNKSRMIPYDDQPLTGGPFLLNDLVSRESNGQPLRIYKIKPDVRNDL